MSVSVSAAVSVSLSVSVCLCVCVDTGYRKSHATSKEPQEIMMYTDNRKLFFLRVDRVSKSHTQRQRSNRT